MLAEAAPLEEAITLYRRAVEAGARALGEETMREAAGRFWSVAETRPYMRARLRLAQSLRAWGGDEEAVAHYGDLLRLNPGDNQGARYELLPLLIAIGRLDEAERLLASYDDDGGGTFPFGRALWQFATDGDTPGTRAALEAAARINPHVVRLLLEPDAMHEVDEHDMVVGGPGEGRWIFTQLWHPWHTVPGAIEWLKRQARAAKAGRRGTSHGTRGRRHTH